MPEEVVRGIMKKYKTSRKTAEKATAIAENTGKNPQSVYHAIRAGYYSKKKGKKK